jgi:ribose 5-phosphate isomerase RpiB
VGDLFDDYSVPRASTAALKFPAAPAGARIVSRHLNWKVLRFGFAIISAEVTESIVDGLL